MPENTQTISAPTALIEVLESSEGNVKAIVLCNCSDYEDSNGELKPTGNNFTRQETIDFVLKKGKWIYPGGEANTDPLIAALNDTQD